MNKSDLEVAKKAADIVDSFEDWDRGSQVVHCLTLALGVAIALASNDKADALGTIDSVVEYIKQDMRKNYDRRMGEHERRMKGTEETKH